MRLNPYYPNYYCACAIFPYFATRDFATVLAFCDRMVGIPFMDFPVHAAIAHAHFGRIEEAHRQIRLYREEFRQRITLGRAPDPGEPLQWLLEINPYRRQADVAFLAERFRALDGADGAAMVVVQPGRHEPERTVAFIARHGEGWCVAYAGREALLPDLKGLQDIQRLILSPGDAFHCLDLAGRQQEDSPGQTVLDDRARQEVKARTAVTWRVRHAVRKIAAAHPEPGRHLANSLRTGILCCYRPERPVAWQLAVRDEAPSRIRVRAH